ncbi:hypothetical protein GGD81_002201 [Rhodobium orientis]|nr:hypothetical protein [Rhodobium orientis]
MERLTPKFDTLEVARFAITWNENDIKLTPSQSRDIFVPTTIMNIDLNVRILPLISDYQFPEATAGERSQNTDSNVPDFGATCGMSRTPRLLQILKRELHILQVTLAGIGEPDARIAPLKQRNAELVLQAHNSAADSGLPDPDHFSCLAQAAILSRSYEVTDF